MINYLILRYVLMTDMRGALARILVVSMLWILGSHCRYVLPFTAGLLRCLHITCIEVGMLRMLLRMLRLLLRLLHIALSCRGLITTHSIARAIAIAALAVHGVRCAVHLVWAGALIECLVLHGAMGA